MTRRDGFTLLELLVVICVMAILAVLLFGAARSLKTSRDVTVDLSNLRAIGTGCTLYSAENNGALPRLATDAESWMRLVWPYIPQTKVFASPSDPQNCVKTGKPVFSTTNNTSYVMNGFNDLGDFTSATFSPRLSMVESPGSTILLAIKSLTAGDRYLDLSLGEHLKNVADYRRYNNSSVYLMIDGSSRKIPFSEYKHSLWLSVKSWTIP